MSLNKIHIMGRLTRDPEIIKTNTGTPIANFRLAVDRDFVDKSTGARGCDFIDCVAFNSTAEFTGKYLKKGRMAVVTGRLQLRDWTDKEGNKRTSAEVVADHLYFADSKPAESAPAPAPAETGSVYGGTSYGGTSSDSSAAMDDDSDLPF